MVMHFNKKYAIWVIAAALIGAGWYYFSRGETQSPYDTVVAERGELLQEVDVTGKIKPQKEASLAFEKGGRITHVYKDVGDTVFAGEQIARLDGGGIYASLLQAQANLETEQIKLEELKRGTRPEEITIQETKVSNAESALLEAKKDVVNKIQDAFVKSDDAVRNQTDQLFANPRTPNPKFSFYTKNQQLVTDVEWERFVVEQALLDWDTAQNVLMGKEDLGGDIDIAKNNLQTIRAFLDKVALLVNSLEPSASLLQATIDGYKADIAAARANVSLATINISTAESSFNAAQSALSLEKNQLTLLRSGTREEQVRAQEARVKSAEAQVLNAQAQYDDTILRAPFSGVVTLQKAKVGEIATAGAPVVSLISEDRYEIEAFIPEADIAVVKIDDKATLTLDAYSTDLVFEARVYAIDPAGTIIEGVATYKVALELIDGDDLIKSGMTADVSISTNRRQDVIAVPARSISTKDGKQYVRILAGGDVQEREVETGLRGSDGRVEIVSGIQEGEEVIVFERR